MLEVSPQERLAYAWAVAASRALHLPTVSERELGQCRQAAYQLSAPECWELLAEVPALQY